MEVSQKAEILNQLEKQLDTGSLEYRGVRYWPIVRSEVHFHRSTNENSAEKGHILRRLKDLFVKSKIVFSPMLQNWRDSDKSDSYRPAQVMMYADLPKRELVDSSYVSKFIDPIADVLDDEADVLITEGSNNPGELRTPRYRASKIINQDLFLKSSPALPEQKEKDLKTMQSLVSALHDHGIHHLDVKTLTGEVNRILHYKHVFLEILAKVRPRIVFYTVYYSKICCGLALACHDLGIKTVEIQHGQQGHVLYTDWCNYPSKPYELLPNVFWTWGKQSYSDIAKWASGPHEVILGGNPWLAFSRKQLTASNKSRGETRQRIQILVALQYLEDFYKGFLPKLMTDSTLDIEWHLRLHPMFSDRTGELKQFLQGLGTDNWEVDNASSTPLYTLLSQMQVLVTFWSTVAYEGSALGLKVIIVHPNGASAMQRYIEEGVFFYVKDASSFTEALAKPPSEPSEPYMVSDHRVMAEAAIQLINDNTV